MSNVFLLTVFTIMLLRLLMFSVAESIETSNHLYNRIGIFGDISSLRLPVLIAF